jgi:hypothetical protein
LLDTNTQTKKIIEFIQYIRNIIHIDDKNKDNIDDDVWIKMIDFAIKTGKPSILDIIDRYYNVVEYTNNVHKLSIPPGTKGIKITRVLKKMIERD